MQRILTTIAFAASVLLAPALLSAAGERDACLDACHDAAVACEAQRCGTEQPAVDSTCGRMCGDRYKQCKADCPQ